MSHDESEGDASANDAYGPIDEVWTYYKITVTGHNRRRRCMNRKIVCKACGQVFINLQRYRALKHIEKCVGIALPKISSGTSGVTKRFRNKEHAISPQDDQPQDDINPSVAQYCQTFNDCDDVMVSPEETSACTVSTAFDYGSLQRHNHNTELAFPTGLQPSSHTNDMLRLSAEIERLKEEIVKVPQRQEMNSLARQVDDLRQVISSQALVRELIGELLRERKKIDSLKKEIEELRKSTPGNNGPQTSTST